MHYLPALKAWQGVSAGTDPVSRNGENLGCVALAERRSQVIVNAGGCSDPLQNIREAAVLAHRASHDSLTFVFLRTCGDYLLCSRLDFPLELLADSIGLSCLFIIGSNPLIEVNVAVRAPFTPLANMSFSRYWFRHGVCSFLSCMSYNTYVHVKKQEKSTILLENRACAVMFFVNVYALSDFQGCIVTHPIL